MLSIHFVSKIIFKYKIFMLVIREKYWFMNESKLYIYNLLALFPTLQIIIIVTTTIGVPY
jgi:hypothetical protein